jgi:phenylacetate-CoA ligase
VLPDGVEGELVLTSLTREAMPVIRYRTRDRTRLLPPTSRGMRRIARITGRTDDMLIIRGVNLFPTQVEELVLQHPRLAGQYQLVVTREGPLDQLEIRCELLPAHAGADAAAVAIELGRHVKALIGVSARVTVGEPGSIERTLVGKAKRVVDLRQR